MTKLSKQKLYRATDLAVARSLRLIGRMPPAIRTPLLRLITQASLRIPILEDRRVRRRVMVLADNVGQAGSEEGRAKILLAAGIILPAYDHAEDLAERYVADLERNPNDLRAIKEFSSLRLLPHTASDDRTAFLGRIATRTKHTESANVALAYLHVQRGEDEKALAALERAEAAKHTTEPLTPDAERRPPGYAVIGPPKAGTTSLHVWLVEHPDVRRPLIKEPRPHFFLPDHPDVYRHFFPKVTDGQLSGDSSASAIYHPWIAPLFLEMNPSLRILVLHRNPVDRAYSHYLMNGRLGSPRPPWADIVDDTIRTSPIPPLDYDAANAHELNEPIGSCILPYLKEWLQVIPRDRLRIVESADVFTDPMGTMRQIHRFLGLSDFTASHFRHANQGSYPAAAPREVNARLAEWFGPHEAALAEFIVDEGLRLGDA